MDGKIETEFFQTFEINKIEINNEKLLELIVCLNKYIPIVGDSIEEIKTSIMYLSIKNKEVVSREIKRVLKPNKSEK